MCVLWLMLTCMITPFWPLPVWLGKKYDCALLMAAPSGWDFHSAPIDVMMIALQDIMGSKLNWSAWYSSSVLVTFLCSCHVHGIR